MAGGPWSCAMQMGNDGSPRADAENGERMAIPPTLCASVATGAASVATGAGAVAARSEERRV
ncbi:MAG: hypothetical protein ACYC4U_33855, partial [Pirellulaceae bacterium]